MAERKKNTENDLDTLYVSIADPIQKRKNILLAIKNSLIVQEEHSKIISVRNQKQEVLSMIKKNLNDVNSDYQKLKKVLPNVKNIISYTEKELSELESQIDNLKGSIAYDKEAIKESEQVVNKLRKTTGSINLKKEDENIKEVKKTPELVEVKNTSVEKNNKKIPLSKLDRIKNNLAVIEAKLKKI